MSRFLADQLTGPLLARLSLDRALDRAGTAIVICTVDELGWPHPAMLSSLEVVARDARNVRFALHARSRSARNVEARGRITVILADEGGAFYLKGDALLVSASMRASPDLARFNLRIDSVLEDNPADYEQARLTSGIRVERDAIDPVRAEALLGELLAD